MNNVLPNEPSEPLLECPIINETLPTTDLQFLPALLPPPHNTRSRNKSS